MKYIMKKYIFILLQCTWGILQTIIGGILVMILLDKVTAFKKYRGSLVCTVLNSHMKGAVSLGYFIICFSPPDEKTCRHEYGHCIQSLILGVFYIFVIGIPSLIWAGCFEKYRKKHNIEYYSFYTEKWANKLGGV